MWVGGDHSFGGGGVISNRLQGQTHPSPHPQGLPGPSDLHPALLISSGLRLLPWDPSSNIFQVSTPPRASLLLCELLFPLQSPSQMPPLLGYLR